MCTQTRLEYVGGLVQCLESCTLHVGERKCFQTFHYICSAQQSGGRMSVTWFYRRNKQNRPYQTLTKVADGFLLLDDNGDWWHVLSVAASDSMEYIHVSADQARMFLAYMGVPWEQAQRRARYDRELRRSSTTLPADWRKPAKNVVSLHTKRAQPRRGAHN